MKFYTLAVYQETYFNGCDNDNFKAQGLADTAYQQRIKSLNGVLSPRLMELATLPDVDDGRIVEAHFIHALQELIFILRCGDLQMGDFDLVLRYKGATMTGKHEQTLARLARAKNLRSSRAPDTGCMKRLERKSRNYLYYTPDLYRYELDVLENGSLEHRFLFHPGHWFAVRCESLEWEKMPAEGQAIPKLPDHFMGGCDAFENRRGRTKRRGTS